MDSLGIYISVPFCKAKCSFCNFASDAFEPGRMDSYVDRLCAEIADSHDRARRLGANLPEHVDTLYFGGGTPSLLTGSQMRSIFARLRSVFHVDPAAEITLECAPGQLAESTLEELLLQGMNRISFGVQSFVDAESAAVGRLHTGAMCVAEIDRLRRAGIEELSLDLIAGLPHQTEASWQHSVDQAIATGVPHVSVYMLEIDAESRLGREALAGGPRYCAATLPSDEQAADFYELACSRLEAAGIAQYEISNFARAGHASRHNLKYWHREPYLGFGLDAHSMLRTTAAALRFQNGNELDNYLADIYLPDSCLPLFTVCSQTVVVQGDEVFEEALFLGLRLNQGVNLATLRLDHGATLADAAQGVFTELAEIGLVALDGERVSLTNRGRLLSNEVFERVLVTA